MKLFVCILIYAHLIQVSLAVYQSPLFGGSVKGVDFDDLAYSMVPKVIGFKKTSVVGVHNGEPFDDEIASTSPVKMKTVCIRYSSWIDGIKTTYILRNGTLVVKDHGVLNTTTPNPVFSAKKSDKDHFKAVSKDAVIEFFDDEYIMHVDVRTDIETETVNYLKI